MQDYHVKEGNTITHNGTQIKIVSVISTSLCQARIRVGNKTTFTILSTDKAALIPGQLSLHLKSINALHLATLTIGKALRVKSISGAAKEKIQYYDIPNVKTLLQCAVPFENNHYTHRYYYWLLRIVDSVLQDVYLSNCSDCHDTGKVKAYDECSHCYGDGCKNCNNTGYVLSHITCQSCKVKYNLTNQLNKLKYKTQTTL